MKNTLMMIVFVVIAFVGAVSVVFVDMFFGHCFVSRLSEKRSERLRNNACRVLKWSQYLIVADGVLVLFVCLCISRHGLFLMSLLLAGFLMLLSIRISARIVAVVSSVSSMRKDIMEQTKRRTARFDAATGDSSQKEEMNGGARHRPSVVFCEVWYMSHKRKLFGLELWAYDDIGVLTVAENEMVFEGEKTKIEIKNISRLSFGRQGRDIMNQWLKVEYEGRVAFFKDGRNHGWDGIFGGTHKMFESVLNLCARRVGVSGHADSGR